MSKHNKKTSKPNIAPAALLRVRLERLWLSPAAPQMPAAQAEAELNTATRGLKPEVVAEGVLSVFQSAPPETQALLEPWLPQWLAGQNAVEALERLLKTGRLAERLRPMGTRWLAALGREVRVPAGSGAEDFYKAWTMDNGSQASITLLWYSNAHHNRVKGLTFLIDYNPPWEGALKDVALLPNKAPQELEEFVLNMWGARTMPLEALDAPTVKRKLLTAFKQNQAANIRLPKDVVLIHQQFFDHVLTLPDAPDTPVVTQDDFYAMSHTGQSPEALSISERTLGGLLRLPTGEEVFIGDLDEDGLLGLGVLDDLFVTGDEDEPDVGEETDESAR